MIARLLAAALLLAVHTSLLHAQEQAPAPTPSVSIEDAFQREFAFLEAQKRELEMRLEQARQSAQRERAALEADIQRLESQLVASRASTERAAELLAQAERELDVNAENSQLLEATFLQAGVTLESLGIERLNTLEFRAQDDVERVRETFALARGLVDTLSRVRSEPGVFFLPDGSEVQGTLVRVGNIAAFGVAGEVAGALAPAGAGRLRLWDRPAAETARALAAGQSPALLQSFLFENVNIAVEAAAGKTVLGIIQSGGVIGWIIVALGGFGLVLTVLRAIFLQRASSDAQQIVERVAGPLKAGRIDEAIAACKQTKGSAARVVTATLRNLDRDRDHLEDIISESILHESSRLNRFGTMILVIAAVAPLLGLLGTVTGMIATFDVITEFGTSDPKLLSGGIAIALTTTQLGLMVAIPFLLLGNMLSGWAERIKDDMEAAALRVSNIHEEARAARS